jgi:hypothetical protein
MAYNTLIVGDTVTINWKAIWCQIIAKNITIKDSAPNNRWDENICTIFSHDFNQDIVQLEQIQQELNNVIEKMKIWLDHHISSISPKFKELKPEQKIWIRWIMMDFIFDTKNRNSINYDQFQILYNTLQSRIAFREIKIKSEAGWGFHR